MWFFWLPHRGCFFAFPDSRNHDSSGSTTPDDFEKYTDSSRQQFSTRPLIPLLVTLPLLTQEWSKPSAGVVGQRKGRSSRLSDSVSGEKHTLVVEQSSSYIVQTASGSSLTPVSSACVTKLVQFNDGQNSHNGMAGGSLTPSASSQPLAHHSAGTAANAGPVVDISASAVPNTTETASDHSNIDPMDTPRSVNIVSYSSTIFHALWLIHFLGRHVAVCFFRRLFSFCLLNWC